MPRPDVSEERRNQILEAATSVFSRRGFHEARMDDIARESGLSKGALYLYYKSKDAIIAALLRRFFALEMRGTRAVIESGGSVTERLLTMTRMLAADLDRLAIAMPVMLEFYAVAARQRSVRLFLSDALAEYRAALAALLREGVARGEFGPLDTESVALTIIALLEGLALLWIVDPHGVAWRDQAEASLRLLLAGLPPPGEARP